MNIKDITIKNNDSKYIIILIEYYVWFGLFTKKRRAYTENHVKGFMLWYWLGTNDSISLMHNTISAMYYDKLKDLNKTKCS